MDSLRNLDFDFCIYIYQNAPFEDEVSSTSVLENIS